MKNILLSLCVVSFFGIASSGSATTYMARGGDWNTPSTWSPAGVPTMTTPNYAGDTVTIPDNVTVTCIGQNEICSVGTSPSTSANCAAGTAAIGSSHAGSGGGIHLGSTATLIYAGPVCFTDGTFTWDTGGIIQYDSSYASGASSNNYTWATVGSGRRSTWAVGVDNGAQGAWQGDAYYSPLRNPSACTSPDSCKAGVINFNGGGAESGIGTIKNVTFQNIQGSAVNSSTASWTTYLGNTADTTFTNVQFVNSGYALFQILANSSRSLTFNRSVITATSNPSNYGIQFYGSASATGTYLVENSVFDAAVQVSTATNNWTFSNIFLYRTHTGSTPSLNIGFQTTDGSVYDQVFTYNNAYNTGIDSSFMRALIPTGNLMNSIFWSEKTAANGVHVQAFSGRLDYNPSTGSTYNFQNNVFGAMGWPLGGPAATTAISFYGNAPSPKTMTASGNIALCGYNGLGAIGFPVGRFTGATSNMSIALQNNSTCGGNGGSMTDTNYQLATGAIGFEANNNYTGLIPMVNSNLWFSSITGYPIPEVCGTPNPYYVGKPGVTLVTNNAIVGTNIAAPAVCNNGASGNASAWVATAPQNDITITNRVPALVEPGRSLPLFDVEYAIPAGLLDGVAGRSPAAYWGAQNGWRGTWSSGTSYSVGDIVSDSQTGVFGGKTMYWRCVQAHTASSTSRPVTGFDNPQVNPYLDHSAYWEEAYLQWFRGQVIAGTTFDDGAIPALADYQGNPEPMYVVGLLNAWLRQGMTNMEPSLWNGCLNGVECGAIQRAAIQHLPPSSAVN